MRSMVKAWGDGLTNTSNGPRKTLEKEHFSKIQKKWRWFIWSAWMRKLWKDGRVGMPHVIYCQKRDHYQARTKQLWTWQVMMRWRIYELQRKSGKFPQRGNQLPTIVNCLLGVGVFTSRYLLCGTDSRMEALMARLINYGCKLPYLSDRFGLKQDEPGSDRILSLVSSVHTYEWSSGFV